MDIKRTMTTSEQDLLKIAQLASIEMDADTSKQLAKDISAIMDFVEILRKVDTSGVEPLPHPLNQTQILRVDTVNDANLSTQLAELIPTFVDHLYWVPKLGPFAKG